MSYEPSSITDFDNNGGLFTYLEPDKIPNEAFAKFENVVAFRGRVKRRRGFTTLGRLRRVLTSVSIGNIDSSDTTYNIFTGMGILITEPNAQVEIGSITNISIAIGLPIGQNLTDTSGTGTLTISGAGPITAASINYATGVLSLTFSGPAAASAATFTGAYYPSLPVMGLRLQDTSVNNQDKFIAFDTKYAYHYVGTPPMFEELPSTTPTTWRGTDYQLFWTTNYWFVNGIRLFWETNFNNDPVTFDPIRYYNNVTWTTFSPLITATDTLWTCRILIPYKDRLLAFNTWEGATGAGQTAATQFPNRLRWSINGNPTDQVNNWRSDIVGRGGFLDAPVQEQVIGVEFQKDILIVKFERSSWKIVYTGNPTLPFVYEKINTELGAESTFSLIPFDQGVMAVGNYGITIDNTINVVRTDEKIPDKVYEINNQNNGINRVYGIRDFVNQLVYWAYPDSDLNPIFNNQVLVYNYINQSWSIFDDSFTCYGYYQAANPYTWATIPTDITWASWDDPWNGGADQAFYPEVIAGNQQGFVVMIDEGTDNGPSLSITNILNDANGTAQLEIINHNLFTGQFIQVSGVLGSASAGQTNPTYFNGMTFKIVVVDSDNVTLQDSFGDVGYPRAPDTAIGTYIGNGVVSVLNNINIFTKRFAPFYENGQQVRLGYIDFQLERTDEGQITCNLYIDDNDVLSLNNSTVDETVEIDPVTQTQVLLTSPEDLTILPFQAQQQKIWHRFFAYLIAQNFQFQLTMSDAQMFGLPDATGVPTEPTIPTAEITLHQYNLYLSRNARLTP